jgi:hypothetical protein
MREVMGIPPVEAEAWAAQEAPALNSLPAPAVVGCWPVERDLLVRCARRMLRPENFPFNGRSVTARRQRIVMSFPHRDRGTRWYLADRCFGN